jgi:triacylglycerol esterase/lipase EstA (alpha/beta hydrolase family)
MLARLQQATTLLWFAAVLGWPSWTLLAGRAGWAVFGTVMLLTGHGFWLGLTFLMARRLNRDDPAPAASWRQWLWAWWGEAAAAPRVFAWQQPFRAHAEPDHLPAAARGQTGVLLVHGFICNRGLWNPWLRQLRAQGRPVVAISLEPVFGSIDDYAGQIEAAVLRLEQATGRPPLLVGHSMGGLAIRAWLRNRAGESARVCGVVTIGTPNHGTWLARWAFSANGLQMRRGSAWLKALAAGERASDLARFLCIYGHCDNIVFPASSACLQGARTCHVPATGHVDLIHHPQVMAEVMARLTSADH